MIALRKRKGKNAFPFIITDVALLVPALRAPFAKRQLLAFKDHDQRGLYHTDCLSDDFCDSMFLWVLIVQYTGAAVSPLASYIVLWLLLDLVISILMRLLAAVLPVSNEGSDFK